MEEPDYLLPNFDPTKLRVPDLQSILRIHEVDYPSSARKSELISLFLANIKPMAQTERREVSPILPDGAIETQIFR